MSTQSTLAETVLTTHHCALVDVAAGVGVGLHVAPEELTTDSITAWWDSRRALDVELRVVGMAVVVLLPMGRFLVGAAPWTLEQYQEPGPESLTPAALRHLEGPPASPLWAEDETPAYAAGRAEVEHHPRLPTLWEELGALLEVEA